jgi:hypothetical protein
MKFERCIDAEVVGLTLLSEDYTKVTEQCSHSDVWCQLEWFFSFIVCDASSQQTT